MQLKCGVTVTVFGQEDRLSARWIVTDVALRGIDTGVLMQQPSLQVLIRQKLENGTLPLNSIPRIWGGPGKEETCDACEGIITKDEMLIEGISLAGGRNPLQLHVECFHLWERERRAIASRTPHPPEIRAGEAGPEAG